jgi:hypothetical protein
MKDGDTSERGTAVLDAVHSSRLTVLENALEALPKETDREKAPEVVEESPAMEVNRLRTEIDDTRDELGVFVSELDRRRHEVMDIKLQVRKHPVVALVAVAAAVGIGLALAGAVVVLVRAARGTRKRRPR